MEEIKFDDDEPIPPPHKKNVFEKHKHCKHCNKIYYILLDQKIILHCFVTLNEKKTNHGFI
jgi:hypothetical protein